MTLESLGNLGEFLGALAVLNSNMQSTDPILNNPYIERVYRIGRRDPSQLTDDERPLFRMIVGRLLLNYEASYLQHQHGIVDSDYWRGRQVALQRLFSQPGVREFWARSLNSSVRSASLPRSATWQSRSPASETRYEAAAPTAGGGSSYPASAPQFPHVYGPIDKQAITSVGVLGRTADGYEWPRRFMPLDSFLTAES